MLPVAERYLQSGSIYVSEKGDELFVYSVIKERLVIEPGVISPNFCDLTLVDAGFSGSDFAVRTAENAFYRTGINSLAGMSGATGLQCAMWHKLWDGCPGRNYGYSFCEIDTLTCLTLRNF